MVSSAWGEAELSPQECESISKNTSISSAATLSSSMAQVKSQAYPQMCGRAWGSSGEDRGKLFQKTTSQEDQVPEESEGRNGEGEDRDLPFLLAAT